MVDLIQKPTQKNEAFGLGSLPRRSQETSVHGEVVTGAFLRLGSNPSVGPAGAYGDFESNAVSRNIPYKAVDSDSVARTTVISPKGVSFAPELN